MPVYAYKARNDSGSLVSGVLEAPSEDDLVKKLMALSYMPVKIMNQATEVRFPVMVFLSTKVKSQDIVMFNMKLSCMVDAGVLLLTSLRVIAGQTANVHFRDIILSVAQKVSEGASFSEALAQYPHVFSPLYVSMVKVGEISGTMNTVLTRVAEYIEKEEDVKQRIQGALLYPMILCITGGIVIFLIITFVIPQFVAVFAKANVPLPLPTLILYQVGLFCKKFWIIAIAGCVALGVSIKIFINTDKGKDWFDDFILKVPIAGSLLREVFIARFTRTLGLLVESSVPILKCLEVLQDAIGNNSYRRVVLQVSQGVERGEKISRQLQGSVYFPNDVVSMVATGEETGKLALMLNKISGFYEMSVDYSVKRLATLIEPFFIVIMGLMVGVIMASMLLPMFDMVKTIQ